MPLPDNPRRALLILHSLHLTLSLCSVRRPSLSKRPRTYSPILCRASQIHVALQGLSYGYVTVFAEVYVTGRVLSLSRTTYLLETDGQLPAVVVSKQHSCRASSSTCKSHTGKRSAWTPRASKEAGGAMANQTRWSSGVRSDRGDP